MEINLVTVMAIALVIMTSGGCGGGVLVRAECQAIIPALVATCQRFVGAGGPKVAPSGECCEAVRNVDIPCMCRLVTPEIERLVSMEKVVYVARTCGLTVPPGTRCGSYTVPPS